MLQNGQTPALRHPAIVDVIDYGVDQGAPYLVMELLEGRPLDRALEEGLAPERSLAIWRELISAVAYAHGCGVIHRDLKPGNAFLQRTPDGTEVLRVLDFGLAKFTDDVETDGTALTRAGAVLGTPAYMSPEQASGGATDASADVYSLGILGYEMLTGKRPFTGSPSDLVRQHVIEKLPPLSAARDDVPRADELDALLCKATAKSKKQRLPDAGALLKEVDAFLANLQPDQRREVPETAKTRPQKLVQAPTLAATAGAVASRAVGATDSSSTAASSSPIERTQANEQRTLRPLWLGVLAGAGALIVLALFVSRMASNARPEPPAAGGPAPVATRAKTSAPPAHLETEPQESMDLLGDLPKDLARARRRHRFGQPVALGTRRDIFRWQRSHPEDPRGWLLMADMDVHWGARTDALRWYAKAKASSADAAQDESMRRNIIIMAGHAKVGRKAQRVAKELWGAHAFALVDQVLSNEKLNKKERRKLEQFHASLRGKN